MVENYHSDPGTKRLKKHLELARTVAQQLGSDLALISKGGVDWQNLVAKGEWVGKNMEEEIDPARRDERDEPYREGEDPSCR